MLKIFDLRYFNIDKFRVKDFNLITKIYYLQQFNLDILKVKDVNQLQKKINLKYEFEICNTMNVTMFIKQYFIILIYILFTR